MAGNEGLSEHAEGGRNSDNALPVLKRRPLVIKV